MPRFFVPCGIRRFITVLATDRHRTLFWTRWIQSSFRYYGLRSTLILSFHIRLPVHDYPLHFGLSAKYFCGFLISLMLATCSVYSISLHYVSAIIFGEDATHRAFLCSLLSPHPASAQIFSSALYYQTPSVCVFPLSETHTEPETKLQCFYILIFTFLNSRRGDKKLLDWMVASVTWIQSARSFCVVTSVAKPRSPSIQCSLAFIKVSVLWVTSSSASRL